MPVIAAITTALYAPLDNGTDHFQPTNLEVTTIDTGNSATNVIPAQDHAQVQCPVQRNLDRGHALGRNRKAHRKR